MIIEDKSNLVNVVNPLPVTGGMLNFTWTYRLPEEGRILGFLVTYTRSGKGGASCLDMLRDIDDGTVRERLTAGGWLGGAPTGKENGLIWAVPAGSADFKINEGTFRTPCRIDIWTVVEQEGELRLYYKNSPTYCRPLKLQFSVQAKEFVPAEYGLFHHLKKAAVVGVELVVTADTSNGEYEDGAAQYCLRSDPTKTEYPIARAALGKPLRFISDSVFQYRANDFEVTMSPKYTDMYEL